MTDGGCALTMADGGCALTMAAGGCALTAAVSDGVVAEVRAAADVCGSTRAVTDEEPTRRREGMRRGSGNKRRITMGRTTASPSQFSGKTVRKKKDEKKKKKRETAEGKPENPRADAQRSERERRPGSSRQEQGNRKDRASKRSS